MAIDEARLVGLLERLEQQWRDSGARVAAALQPGLSDEQIDALVEPLGIRMPDELRIWWRWHNGAEPAYSTPGEWECASLEKAIDRYHFHRELTPEPFAPELPEMYWHTSWLPILLSKDVLFTDTALIGPGDAAPLQVRPWEWTGYDRIVVPSFTDMIALWVEALDRRWVYWNTEQEIFEQDYWGALPEEYRGHPLL